MREIVKRETIGASIGVRGRARCSGAGRVRAASQCRLWRAEARAGKVGSPSGVLFIDLCGGARCDWKCRAAGGDQGGQCVHGLPSMRGRALWAAQRAGRC